MAHSRQQMERIELKTFNQIQSSVRSLTQDIAMATEASVGTVLMTIDDE